MSFANVFKTSEGARKAWLTRHRNAAQAAPAKTKAKVKAAPPTPAKPDSKTPANVGGASQAELRAKKKLPGSSIRTIEGTLYDLKDKSVKPPLHPAEIQEAGPGREAFATWSNRTWGSANEWSVGYRKSKGAVEEDKKANDMAAAIKRDANGKPIAFHGTTADFKQFDMHKLTPNWDQQQSGFGLYFASKKEVADVYANGKNLHIVSLDIKPENTLNLDKPIGAARLKALKLPGMDSSASDNTLDFINNLEDHLKGNAPKGDKKRGPVLAQEYLKAKGIKAGVYEDYATILASGSKASGQKNYVVYDDTVIKIHKTIKKEDNPAEDFPVSSDSRGIFTIMELEGEPYKVYVPGSKPFIQKADAMTTFINVLKTSEGAKKAWATRNASGGGRMPLKGHAYHGKSDVELRGIIRDASEAAKAMQGHSPRSEGKYLDQVNDASTVLYHRKTTAAQGGDSETARIKASMGAYKSGGMLAKVLTQGKASSTKKDDGMVISPVDVPMNPTAIDSINSTMRTQGLGLKMPNQRKKFNRASMATVVTQAPAQKAEKPLHAAKDDQHRFLGW